MVIGDKVAIIRAMAAKGTENMDYNAIASYLEGAKYAILNRLYPYKDTSGMEIPEKYEFLQIKVAVYNINKRGAEFELRHIEVGTERDYASADIPDDVLKEFVPMCGVPM